MNKEQYKNFKNALLGIKEWKLNILSVLRDVFIFLTYLMFTVALVSLTNAVESVTIFTTGFAFVLSLVFSCIADMFESKYELKIINKVIDNMKKDTD